MLLPTAAGDLPSLVAQGVSMFQKINDTGTDVVRRFSLSRRGASVERNDLFFLRNVVQQAMPPSVRAPSLSDH